MTISYPYNPKLWSRVNRRIDRRGEDDCWLWTGPVTTRTGYGYITLQVDHERKNLPAHRLVMAREQGSAIGKGLAVLHRCDVPLCCNPSHLQVGTQADNIRDCIAKGRHAGQRLTHCKNGHPFDESNTYVLRRTGARWRQCRTCNNARHREKYHADRKEETL